MRCCVPACKNDSRHLSKSQGITFHLFPNEPILRSAWLYVLGKESWEPKERSAVCSDHFHCEDLYETKTGLRKVKSGAVPVVQWKEFDFGETSDLKICRICLAVDGRLLSIRKYKLEEAYHNLTGLEGFDKMPQQLCTECAQRLHNSSELRNRSLRAHAIMMEIVRRQDSLTMENIATVNRENNKLTSNLVPKYFNPNYCDYSIDHEKLQEEKEIGLFEVNVPDEMEIKHESNNVFNEFNDNDVKEENNYVTNDIISNDDDDNDRDFVASDREYSSDDSLPLDARRKKVKVEKKKIEKKEDIKKVRKRQVTDPSQPKVDRRRKPFLNEDLSETLFTITDLTQAEQIQDIQKRRDTSNYKNSMFKCEACFKGFLDENAYNSHVLRHTDRCGEYECGICKTHFKHPHALRKHVTAHHTQRFTCNLCPYVTTHRQTARLHERWHKGTKYQCPHCQDEFMKFTTYMGHIRIKHPSDFVCQLCGYSFVSVKGIELHKKLKHRLDDPQIPEDGPFCALCNVRFVSSEALRRHVHVSARHTASDKEDKEPRARNRKARAHSARDRKRSRSSSSERRRGPNVRRPEGPIPCEQCGMQLEDSRAYHGHFRRMHPDKNRTNYPSMKSPCMCEVCGRMFQSYALLKDHTWTHTGERPFKCDSCDKSFRMKQRLVAHRRVHSAQRATYQCGACGKQFSTHSNRQRHMAVSCSIRQSLRMKQRLVAHRRVHSAQRATYQCGACGKQFSTHSNRQRHMAVSCSIRQSLRMKQRLVAHRRVHSAQRATYQCGACGKQFSTHSNRQRHMAVSCSIRQSLRMKQRLVAHRRVHSAQRATYQCGACGKQFSTHSNRQRHMAVSCSIRQSLRMKQRLVAHRRVHSAQRATYQCGACGKQFSTHSNRQRHMAVSCSIRQSLRMKQRLVAHRRVHSAQRATYQCGACGKQFSTHSNRQRHMAIHTGLKPFKCEMCGKCFKHASEKRAHITYVHLKKPWPKRARGKRRPDQRQGMQHPQMSAPTSASEMELVQPLWPSCDPKLADINVIMDDKPLYYNLKI